MKTKNGESPRWCSRSSNHKYHKHHKSQSGQGIKKNICSITSNIMWWIKVEMGPIWDSGLCEFSWRKNNHGRWYDWIPLQHLPQWCSWETARLHWTHQRLPRVGFPLVFLEARIVKRKVLVLAMRARCCNYKTIHSKHTWIILLLPLYTTLPVH